MRTRTPFLLPALMCALAAQEPITLEAPIQRVRLHPDQAWITRLGTVQLPAAGTHRIQIKGLPKGLGLEDVRIAARGPAGSRLGELSVRQEHQPHADLPEWKRLQEELAKVDAELFQLNLRGQNQTQATSLFHELSEGQLRETRRRMGMGSVKPQVLLDLTAAIEARTLELERSRTALDHERMQLDARKAKLSEAQDRLQEAAEARPVRVLADIDMPRAGCVEVELTYRSATASWHPAYEARLSPDRSHLELVLLAAIKQDSEQDWAGVELELANQQASGKLESPTPPSLPALNFMEGEAPKTPVRLGIAGPATTQATLSFKVPGRVDVPRAEEQRFRVTSLDLAPTFRYLALPRQSSAVYLLALVSPPPSFPLMPGSPLNLMQGQERLGSLSLEPPAPGEPLRLSFGAVPGLSASRQVVSNGFKEVGEKAKEREWTLQERLVISNTLSTRAEVEVQDRRITSGTESITVTEDGEANPEAAETPTGLRAWQLKVEPGTQGFLHLRTRIRGPLVGRITQLGDLKLEGNN